MTRTLPAPTRAYAEGVDASAPITFLASTPNYARDGLALRASGWLVDNYRANPVFLHAHDYRSLPIGRGVPILDGTALRLSVEFDQADPFAVKVERKYRNGFLNAVSVGWDFTDANAQKIDYWRMSAEQLQREAFYDLLEVSAVAVPADPGALAERQRSALAAYGRELVDLFDAAEDGTTLTVEDVREAVAAELVRLGIQIPTPGVGGNTDPTPVVVDNNAARNLLAAFSTGDNAHE